VSLGVVVRDGEQPILRATADDLRANMDAAEYR